MSLPVDAGPLDLSLVYSAGMAIMSLLPQVYKFTPRTDDLYDLFPIRDLDL